ncbi:UDP-glycosyltransferase [Flavobacterium paronense]|uniref:UDP-glycosyltransferase n=2 Tax=Flavobacterium paronense TaxID=1392775 RepID=A0ABV5GAS3_9FLAO
MKEKIFILLPDGLGLRNFGYTDFYKKAADKNFEIIFWNITPFPLADMGYPELKISNAKIHPLTDIYKKAKVQVEFNLNIKRTKDKIYNRYRFPFSYSTIKNATKSILVNSVTFTHSTKWGLLRIRRKINENERKTHYYHQSLATLEKEKPAMVFCTNQRHITTVAPLLAAKDLGIPTATFIFSWDNLPKATMVVETDYYFVWSDYMKEELLFYYTYIKPEQIVVTGSPQFETHFDKNNLLTKEAFFMQNDLDLAKKYVCFSGNDETSSPDDPKYLEDIAKAVKKLNEQGNNLGVIFRRSPVDFSGRFDFIKEKYKEEVTFIEPLWKSLSTAWDSILPTIEDNVLFSNLAEHTELVLTIGSSTVFDFIAHNKPTAYLKYNQQEQLNVKWDIYKCYGFVHFRSMPSQEVVFWINNPEEMATAILNAMSKNEKILRQAGKWFEKINQNPPQLASERIWNAIDKIIKN